MRAIRGILFEKEKMMSHPDPLYDPDNSYEDDDMNEDFAQEVEDYNDYYIEENSVDDEDDFYEDEYDDSMDGDHESGLSSAGWGTDEDYGYYGEDY
jgi:hypothetical protein